MLKDMIEQLTTASKPLVKRFEQEEGSHVLAIGLGKDVILKEHKSDIPARILVIKGAIIYIAGDKRKELNIYDEHVIPVGEYHSVEPLEDSVFLVIKK
ncbi:cupin domain-containing protein [Salinimicrobium xinjiangense]|uniref:hypothetical protein n=1 Tax=Salinimicrobium xinjiangense TaxID=438596 RepID=UPI000404E88A|nr:hypothetical protein [Salinimicrobium xinjiangense]